MTAVLCALAMILGACGGGSTTGGAATSAATQAAAGAAQTTAAATEAAAAAEATTAAAAAQATTAAPTAAAAGAGAGAGGGAGADATAAASSRPEDTTLWTLDDWVAACVDGTLIDGSDTFPIYDQRVVFTMMGSKAPIQGIWENLIFFRSMEQLTNIAFDLDTPVSDGFEEKKNLAINTGAYPEIFFGARLNPQQEIRYGSNEGILIPLEDLIAQYAPNITTMFDTHPDVRQSVTTPDGHIYALPQISKGVKWVHEHWFNARWMEALEVTEADLPSDLDGMFDLFMRMKTEIPGAIGVDEVWPISIEKPTESGSSFRTMFLASFGILPSYNSIYVLDDGIVRFSYLEPNYPEYLKYVNKLWEAGIIDRDSFMQDYPAVNAKCKSNIVGLARQASPSNLYELRDNDDGVNFPVLPPLTSSIYTTPLKATTGESMTRGVFALTDKCKDPVAMMKWVDYLYSVEGSYFIHYGPYGYGYVRDDEGRRVGQPTTDGRTSEERRGGDITPDCGTPTPKWIRDDTERNVANVFSIYRITHVQDVVLSPYARDAYPNIYTTPEEQSELDEIIVDINKLCVSEEAKYITGEADIENYESFVSILKQMGVDRVVEIYQAAYDRWRDAA
ncbi:MAG: hypothetical protein FWH01_15695 [Oscillospiraceae bacterium]|nr:hypothetical protein [Oscillospiraceae bacterium]